MLRKTQAPVGTTHLALGVALLHSRQFHTLLDPIIQCIQAAFDIFPEYFNFTFHVINVLCHTQVTLSNFPYFYTS